MVLRAQFVGRRQGPDARRIVLGILTIALLAPLLSPYDPNLQETANRLMPPSTAHWLGTDGFGRDMLSRLIYGARPTLLLVLIVVLLMAPLGMLIGILAGFSGGVTERVLMRVTDIVMSFPRLLLAFAFVAIMGPGLINGALALALTSWPAYARQARVETALLRRSDYMAAAEMVGIGGVRLLWGHVMPLVLPSAVIRLALDLSGIILAAAGLGFLGLGVRPPTAEWGSMVSEGTQVIFDQWWVAAIPGFAILVASFAFNLLADGLRDILDPMTEPLLSLDELSISFPSENGMARVVDRISFSIGREIVALVGESGSGKSMTGRAIMGLLPRRAQLQAKSLAFEGRDLATLSPSGWNRIRGNDIGLVLQDPKYSLNPAHKVGRQVEETLLLHTRLSSTERRRQALDMLSRVGLADPERIYSSYPSALSGGMGQRVMIAAMLINRPKLLIADEPTSALDRGLQDQILTLLRSLTREFGMGLLLISHDLQQVSIYADRVAVMRRGRIEEQMNAADLSQAKSSYTRTLWAARPSAATYGSLLPTSEDEP